MRNQWPRPLVRIFSFKKFLSTSLCKHRLLNDNRYSGSLSAPVIRSYCDRHFGIGGYFFIRISAERYGSIIIDFTANGRIACFDSPVLQRHRGSAGNRSCMPSENFSVVPVTSWLPPLNIARYHGFRVLPGKTDHSSCLIQFACRVDSSSG